MSGMMSSIQRLTWHCPIRIWMPLSNMSIIGSGSTAPAYTPESESVPPLRTVFIAFDSALSRSTPNRSTIGSPRDSGSLEASAERLRGDDRRWIKSTFRASDRTREGLRAMWCACSARGVRRDGRRTSGGATTRTPREVFVAASGPASVLVVEVDAEESLPEAVDVVVRHVAGLAW